MIGSVLEPEWDDVERAWMLAREHYRQVDQCQVCGMPKAICRSIETDGMVAVDSERCHVSAAIARKQRADQQAEMDLPETLAYEARMHQPDELPPEAAP